VVAATAAALLGGCGATPSLPEPGANGVVVVHSWEHPGDNPSRIEARHIHQVDSSFSALDLDDVTMRLPKPDGVVYLVSPLATYDQNAVNTILLFGHPGDDGPVRFNGVWRGKLFVGRAAHAEFSQRTHGMVFTDVEIATQGVCQWTATAEWKENQPLIYGKTERRPDVPAVVAALAALPQPLDLPER
jgi:hypothetical protein